MGERLAIEREETERSIAAQALRLSELWGGFWEFGDDSADEMTFMAGLQELMDCCIDYKRSKSPPA